MSRVAGAGEIRLVGDGGGYRRARTGEQPDASLIVGPSRMGGFLRCTFDPDRTPKGPPGGARARQALEFADRELGTDFGPLEEAIAVP